MLEYKLKVCHFWHLTATDNLFCVINHAQNFHVGVWGDWIFSVTWKILSLSALLKEIVLFEIRTLRMLRQWWCYAWEKWKFMEECSFIGNLSCHYEYGWKHHSVVLGLCSAQYIPNGFFYYGPNAVLLLWSKIVTTFLTSKRKWISYFQPLLWLALVENPDSIPAVALETLFSLLKSPRLILDVLMTKSAEMRNKIAFLIFNTWLCLFFHLPK